MKKLIPFLFVLFLSHFCFGKDLRSVPDEGLDMIEIVQKRGYTIESHYVTTEDLYILGLFRIPCPNNQSSCTSGRPVAYLQHGLEDSSYTWVNNFQNESLAFILADNGFDVWMGNARGNTYSLNHVNLPTDGKKFWEFSYDEMAAYDLPASISYVLNVTNQKSLGYVGHSQGTISMFASLSVNQSLAAQVNFFAALAPVAYVHHQESVLIDIVAAVPDDAVYGVFGDKSFGPSTKLLEELDPGVCELFAYACADLIFLVAGPSQNLNDSRLDVYVSESPGGTSVKNMVHWSQGVSKEVFQMYDYGCGLLTCDNKEHYGQDTPPAYNLSNTIIPTALYHGGEDYLADPTDVNTLISMLPRDSLEYVLNITDFAHLDFVWAPSAARLVYPDVMYRLQSHAANPDYFVEFNKMKINNY